QTNIARQTRYFVSQRAGRAVERHEKLRSWIPLGINSLHQLVQFGSVIFGKMDDHRDIGPVVAEGEWIAWKSSRLECLFYGYRYPFSVGSQVNGCMRHVKGNALQKLHCLGAHMRELS